MAASMLSFDPVDRLTHDQHLSLLRYLCDAALDSEKLRGVLQRKRSPWAALGMRGAALAACLRVCGAPPPSARQRRSAAHTPTRCAMPRRRPPSYP